MQSVPPPRQAVSQITLQSHRTTHQNSIFSLAAKPAPLYTGFGLRSKSLLHHHPHPRAHTPHTTVLTNYHDDVWWLEMQDGLKHTAMGSLFILPAPLTLHSHRLCPKSHTTVLNRRAPETPACRVSASYMCRSQFRTRNGCVPKYIKISRPDWWGTEH